MSYSWNTKTIRFLVKETYKMFMKNGGIKKFDPIFLICMIPHENENVSEFLTDIINHDRLKKMVLDKERIYE